MKIVEHVTWDHLAIENIQEHMTCVICDILTEPKIVHYSDNVNIRGGTCSRCGFTFLHPSDILKAVQLMMSRKSVLQDNKSQPP